ncbi:PKD domain-containing protein [Methanospirillum sp.]|uniref:PKD domain-containing protein n=1 Tax=Methanospirillum sp. TaxID=45200 RepID=UPI0035A10DB7
MVRKGLKTVFIRTIWLLTLICISYILINPVCAVGQNVWVPHVEQGGTVFIGETHLDIYDALLDPNDPTKTIMIDFLGWWGDDVMAGTGTSADKYIDIASGEEFDYFINPVEYIMNNRYTEGAFYLCDRSTGQPIIYNGKNVVAFYVELPHIELVVSDDVCPDVNRTGEVFIGTNLDFNIKTNLYKIQQRTGVPYPVAPRTKVLPAGADVRFFDLNVTGVNGKEYVRLLGPDTVKNWPKNCRCDQDIKGEVSLKDLYIPTNTFKWTGWDTSALNHDTCLLDTPEGAYSIYAKCWANNIIDSYVTIGGAQSKTANINLVPEIVSVSVNPDSILRTESSVATIIGKPKTEYIIALMECPLRMTGKVCDRPPWFEKTIVNNTITLFNTTFDPEGGQYLIGNNIVYPACCDDLTFRDVVPKDFHDGVYYYANITTDCEGVAKINIKVDNTVWKANDNPVYMVHVQKRLHECNGVHIFDRTEITVKKGDISIQISQASDDTNTPITEAYLGDILKIAGTNTDSYQTFLYMIGPCQPECGGGLIPVPYPYGPIGPGPELIINSQPRVEGFDWIFTNDIGGQPRFWETGFLPINPGNYTIYAISNWPPHCPACLDCRGTTCTLDKAKCNGCDGNVCTLTDCPHCDVYAVATIQLKAPELTAITEDIERCCCPGYPCGETIDGQPIPVSGISTGNPDKKLNVWLLGKGKIGDVKYINRQFTVNCDGTFSFDVVRDLLLYNNTTLCQIDAGTYDLIIQDPGYNHQFDVIHERDLSTKYWARPVEINKEWILSGFPDIGSYKKLDVSTTQNWNPNSDFLTNVDVESEHTSDPSLPWDDDWRKLVQVEGPGYKLGTEVLYALIKGLDDPNVDDNYVHIQFTVSDKSCLVGTDFDADRTYGNKPLTVRFTDKSYQATSWLWDFGDGTTSTEQNPIHTFTEEGRYTISLITNGDDKGKAVKNDYIRVAKGPTAKFVFAPKDVTVGIDVQFTDLSSGNPTSWLWHFGDGSSSPLQSPVYTYLTPGVYTVMLTVSDENGISSDSATQIISVQGSSTPVVADFKTEVTNGTNVQFIDLSSGFGIISWVWDFGDGSTSTERNPKHTYLKEGTYEVSLTVSNESFENIVKKIIGIR